MSCGGAPYCGVLTLETGDGDGNYAHEYPQLHGLWPQVGNYGDSECVSPAGDKGTNVKQYMDCYTDPEFAQHEWEAHGFCAASEPRSFFTQACNLARGPVNTMKQMKANGDSLDDMAAALEKDGYEVVTVDKSESQLELSCCAGSDGKWKLARTRDFAKTCGK
jgi:hypothetical protein